MSAAYSLVVMHLQLGASDCEALGDGLLGQPVNAVSSLLYVAVGLLLAVRALSDRGQDLASRVLFGLLVAGVGLGSAGFHGPMPAGARFIHDVTIAALLGFIIVRGAGLMRGWSQADGFKRLAVLTAAAGVVIAVAPDAAAVVIALMGAGAVGIELAVHKAAVHEKPSPSGTRWLVFGLALLAVAGIVNVLGRTGGPWCDPASVLQPHALWHIITAVVLGLYGWFAFPSPGHSSQP